MPRKPEVILSKIGNVSSSCARESFISRQARATKIRWKINPMKSIVFKRGNDPLAVVRATITHHPYFEIVEILPENRLECKSQGSTTVVGRNNYANDCVRHSIHLNAKATKTNTISAFLS